MEQLESFFATQVGNGHSAKGVICFVSQGMTQWPFMTCMVVQRVPTLHIEPGGHVRHSHCFRGPMSCRYSWPILQVPQGGFSQEVFSSFGSRPGAHVLHFTCPRVSWYCPSGHGVHWSNNNVRNLPIAHCWQVWLPVPTASSPSRQSSHPMAPGFSDLVLTKHGLHVAEPCWF